MPHLNYVTEQTVYTTPWTAHGVRYSNTWTSIAWLWVENILSNALKYTSAAFFYPHQTREKYRCTVYTHTHTHTQMCRHLVKCYVKSHEKRKVIMPFYYDYYTTMRGAPVRSANREEGDAWREKAWRKYERVHLLNLKDLLYVVLFLHSSVRRSG